MKRFAAEEKIRSDKQVHPDRYCPAKNCVWRTHRLVCGPPGTRELVWGFLPCPNHAMGRK